MHILQGFGSTHGSFDDVLVVLGGLVAVGAKGRHPQLAVGVEVDVGDDVALLGDVIGHHLGLQGGKRLGSVVAVVARVARAAAMVPHKAPVSVRVLANEIQ